MISRLDIKSGELAYYTNKTEEEMAALYTKEELKETNDQDFITDCGVYVDEEYMDELIEIMRKHWEKTIG